MTDRRTGEVERNPGPYELVPCRSFEGTGAYCSECGWAQHKHDEADEQGRDVREEREGR